MSNVIGIEQFQELYDHATAKKYGSLIIDTTSDKRFLSNLDSELFIDNAENKICLINREMPITKIDEIDKDMLLRPSLILYPEVEDWLLNLAIEAYENSLHPKEKDELIEN